ncbi:hypothetical protein D3C87_2075710 [compost metagenome]
MIAVVYPRGDHRADIERRFIFGSTLRDIDLDVQRVVLRPELEDLIGDLVGCPFALGL